MKLFQWTSRDGDVLEVPNTGAPYLVSELKGFSEPPEFNQITQQGPFQHGATATRAFSRARAIRFALVIIGSSLANLEATKRFVGRVFSGLNAQGLPNEGTLRVTGEDDVVYAIDAVPTGCDFPPGSGNRSRLHQKASVYLTANDPWWRIEPVNQAALATGETTSVTNAGDIPVYPEWTIDGPCEDPKLENLTTGQFLEFSGTVPSGWRLEVGHRIGQKYARIVEIADEENTVNWMPFLSADSIFWNLIVGANDIEFTSVAIDSSGDPGGEGVLSWFTLFQTIPI